MSVRNIVTVSLFFIPLLIWGFLLTSRGTLIYLCLGFTIYVMGVLAVKENRRFNVIVRILLTVSLILMLLYILAAVNVTPNSAFLAWRQVFISQHLKGGLLAHLTVLLILVFTFLLLQAGTRIKMYQTFCIFLLFHAVIFGIVYNNPKALIFIGLLFVLYSALYYRDNGNLKRIILGFYGIIPAFIFALITGQCQTAVSSNLNFNFDFSETIEKIYPGFPFLESQPEFESDGPGRNTKNIFLLSDRQLFTITASEKTLLYVKTRAYDTFSDSAWSQSQYTENLKETITLENSQTPSDALLEINTEFSSFLPVPYGYKIQNIKGHSVSGSYRFGWYLKPMLIKGETVSFIRDDTFGINNYNNADIQLPSEDYLPEIDIPENTDTMASLNIIIEYLQKNYRYTLRPEYSTSQTIISGFVEEKKGFCTHFASMFVLLARKAGIPARFVTGYIVYNPYGLNQTEINGYNSHSWAEAFIPGKGWHLFEPTPPMNNPQIASSNPYDRQTQRQLEAVFGLPSTDKNRVQKTQKSVITNKTLFRLTAISLLSIIVIVFTTVCVKIIFLNDYFCIKMPNALSCIHRYGVEQGADSAQYSGWRGWAETWDCKKQWLPVRLSNIWTAHIFGDKEITKRDRRYIRSAVRFIRNTR